MNQLDLLDCPFFDKDPKKRCGLPSEILRQDTAQSTDGPVEIIAIRCIEGHYFCGPVDAMWIPGGEPWLRM